MVHVGGGVVDDLENVSLVDGFAAVEAQGECLLGFLVLDVVQEALLASAVPATRHRSLDHGLLGAYRAFVPDLSLNLLENMSAEFICDILLP